MSNHAVFPRSSRFALIVCVLAADARRRARGRGSAAVRAAGRAEGCLHLDGRVEADAGRRLQRDERRAGNVAGDRRRGEPGRLAAGDPALGVVVHAEVRRQRADRVAGACRAGVRRHLPGRAGEAESVARACGWTRRRSSRRCRRTRTSWQRGGSSRRRCAGRRRPLHRRPASRRRSDFVFTVGRGRRRQQDLP